MNKLYPNAAAALEGVLFDGMMICAGGFGLCGIPDRLIDAIRDAGTTGLTIADETASLYLMINLVSTTILQLVLDPPAEVEPDRLLAALSTRITRWLA